MTTLTLAKMTDKKWKEIAPRLPRTYAPEQISKRFQKLGDGVVYAAGTSWVAVVDDDDGRGTFHVMRASDEAPQKTDVAPEKSLRLHDVSADGKRACVAGSEDLREVDLETLKSRVVFRLPDESWASSIAYLAGERAAIVQGETLRFVATGTKWREIASMKLEGENDLTAIRGGTILLVTPDGWYGARRPVAYAVEADGLKEIGRADAHFKQGADELGGRVFVTDSKWKRHELLGLPDAPKEARPDVAEDDFVFFGENPNDWYEGANLGHAYELAFREEPSAKEKEKLAKVFQKSTRKGAVEGGSWSWDGRWALLFLGERSAHGPRFFDAVRAVFDQVHAVAPLEEVIFRGTRADSTVYPRKPTPGPRWPNVAFPSADSVFASTATSKKK